MLLKEIKRGYDLRVIDEMLLVRERVVRIKYEGDRPNKFRDGNAFLPPRRYIPGITFDVAVSSG